jgi:beta-galactosidase
MNSIRTVQVVPEGFVIGDEVVPVYSGSIHYWRHKCQDWARILDGVQRMGFRFLDTYFPWNVHEVSPGRFDFGEITPEKDIAAFLRACQDAGLFVLCRPGPHINAELPFFGYPERVVNNPDIQMRTATGAPAVLPVVNIPIVAPSYASEQFYEEVAGYFDAVVPVLKAFIYPAGPIVAIQADNEMSFFFRTRCYDVDYHPQAITLYWRFLERKYREIAVLNTAYRSAYTSFTDVEPPREYRARERADLPYYLDWAEYQEEYVNYGLIRIRRMLEERGLTGVPYYHNYPTIYPESPFRMAELEKHLDIAGVDAYPRPDQYPSVKRGAQFTSTMSRLPFIPEFGAGVWAWNMPQKPEDHLFNTRATFMHGIRAINYYMLADRDRWLNTPLQEDGTPRESMFAVYERWNALLHDLNWAKLRVERKVLILTPRVYERLRYVAIEGAIPYDWIMSFYIQLPADLFLSESIPGTRDAVHRQMRVWIDAFRVALEVVGVPYGLGDSDIAPEQLAGYPIVIMPTFDWIDRELLEKLDAYVRGGGFLICGPRLPSETVSGEPLTFWPAVPSGTPASRVELDDGLWLEDADLRGYSSAFIHKFGVGSGTVALVSALFPPAGLLKEGQRSYRRWAGQLKSLLAEAGVSPVWSCNNPELEVTVLSGGGRRVVCLANSTPEIQTGFLSVEGANSWTNIDTGAQTEGTLPIEIGPWTINIWEVKS